MVEETTMKTIRTLKTMRFKTKAFSSYLAVIFRFSGFLSGIDRICSHSAIIERLYIIRNVVLRFLARCSHNVSILFRLIFPLPQKIIML